MEAVVCPATAGRRHILGSFPAIGGIPGAVSWSGIVGGRERNAVEKPPLLAGQGTQT